MLRRLVLAVILVLGLAVPALAERRVALLLAAEDYRNLRPLSNPTNDVRAMEKVLEDLGFEVWVERDRDLRRMRRALEDFEADATGADVALLFYAGHGVAIEGVNYLLPVDAEARSSARLKETSLPLSEVQEVMARIAPVSIFLLDACRDDPFAQGAGAAPDGRGAVALADDPPSVPKPVPGLGRIGRADGALFAFAAAPGETASDGSEGNSPFTQALSRHFGTEGVELKSALTLVQQDVYDRSRGKQLPYIESGVAQLVFITDQGELPERDALLLAMAGVTPEMRAEVEAIAAFNDMPLAPLYRALVSGDLAKLGAEDRKRKLEEAALSYGAFETELMRYASDDPRVAALRTRAEEELALGSTETARSLINQAVALDAEARIGLKQDLEDVRESFVARTLSEAGSHRLNASAARTDLRYDLAIEDLTRASELYVEVLDQLPDRQTRFAYAATLGELGDLQSRAGNSFGALGAQMTRVDWLETQAAADPLDLGWGQELIWALQAVGQILSEQGFTREAEEYWLRAWGQSSRQFAEDPENPDRMRDHMVVLNQMGDMDHARANYQSAANWYGDALQVAQALLEGAPDNVTYRRDLAFTHQRIGDNWLALGKHEQARAAYEVSLRLSQELASRFPDNLDMQRSLSLALERLGDIMSLEEDHDSALAIYRESLRINEAMVARDPGAVEHLRGKARVLVLLGGVYLQLGDPGTALMSHVEALGIREQLVARDPANSSWAQDLSVSYMQIGDLHVHENDVIGAMAYFDKARSVRAAIVALDPSNAMARHELTYATERIALAHQLLGEIAQASVLAGEVLAIRRELVSQDPTVRVFRTSLAQSLRLEADLMLAAGDAAAALPLLREGEALRKGLRDDSPGDPAAQRALSVDQNVLSSLLLQLSRGDEALAVAESSLAAAEVLLGIEGSPEAWHDLMVALERLGEAHALTGDLTSAHGIFARMEAIAGERLAIAPGDRQRVEEHAIALERLGDTLLGLGDHAGAEAVFTDAVAKREWLAARAPTEPGPAYWLALALQRQADSHFLRGDTTSGMPLEERAVGILRWLHEMLPEDAAITLEYVKGLGRMAGYLADPSQYQAEALRLLETLEASGQLPDPVWQEQMANYRKALGR